MKLFYAFFITFFLAGTISSQCIIDNAGFENWTDITADFNAQYNTNVTEGSLLFANNFSPVTGLIGLLYGSVDVPTVVNNVSEDKLGDALFGMSRSDESYRGEYSLKIGASSIYDDINISFNDDCVPINSETFRFTFKHAESQTPDSLYVYVLMGESLTDLRNVTSLNDPSIGKYAVDAISSTDSHGWLTRKVNLTTNNSNLSLDSVLIDISYFSSTPDDKSFFLLDEIKFEGQVNVTDALAHIDFTIGQNTSNNLIFPQLDLSLVNYVSSSILDMNGRKIKSFSTWKDVIDISDLSSGSYIFSVICEEGIKSKLFIKP